MIEVHSGSYNILYIYNEANLFFYFTIHHFGQIISKISPYLKKKMKKNTKIHCDICIYMGTNEYKNLLFLA